jgi:hypothetical protein
LEIELGIKEEKEWMYFDWVLTNDFIGKRKIHSYFFKFSKIHYTQVESNLARLDG